MKCCSIISLWLFGAIAALSGGLLVALYPIMYDHVLRDLMMVYPGSMSHGIWKELPIPMYMKVYFWNVTNYQDITDRVQGVKPILEEVGPYVFEEHHTKQDEDWDSENGTVSFRQVKTWIFLPEMSNGSLDDDIVNINMVAAAAAEYARHRDHFYTYILNKMFIQQNVPLFMNAKVWNLTFGGVLDEILLAVDTFPQWGLTPPIPFDKFGWFYERNDSASYDGNFTMFTGVENLEDVGQIKLWNNLTHVNESIYPGYCGQLNGSAGEFFPANRDKTYLDYFTPDLCRSIRFFYDKKTKVRGVPGYKYILDDILVANETYYPDNFCFNPHPVPDQHLPNGLLNVSSCKFDAPAYVSYPHFHLADPALIGQFAPAAASGRPIRPDVRLHGSSLSLEPGTGAPLRVDIRMQINGLIRPISKLTQNGIDYVNISIYDGLEPTFYPLLWFETTTELDDEFARMLKLVLNIQIGVPGFGWSLVGLGIALFLLGVFLLVRAFRRKERRKKDLKLYDD